jgi:hypothetical protein
MDPIDYSCIHLSTVIDKLQHVLHSLNITAQDEIITKLATSVASNNVLVQDTGLGQVGVIDGLLKSSETNTSTTDFTMLFSGMMFAIVLLLFAVKNTTNRRYTSVVDVLVFRMVYPLIASIFVLPLMFINMFLRLCFALTGRIGFKEILNNVCYCIEKDMDHNIIVHVGEPIVNSEYQPINSHGNCSHNHNDQEL